MAASFGAAFSLGGGALLRPARQPSRQTSSRVAPAAPPRSEVLAAYAAPVFSATPTRPSR